MVNMSSTCRNALEYKRAEFLGLRVLLYTRQMPFTLYDCGGVWDRKQIHRRPEVCTRGHQLCYFPGSRSCPCPRSHPRPCTPRLCLGSLPSPPLTIIPHHQWYLFDYKSLQNRWWPPFPVAACQDFVSSSSTVNNFPCKDLAGKDGYGYVRCLQYCGSSGSGHCSCGRFSSFLGGMPTEGLTQSRTEIYTWWEYIVGKIYTSVFFWYLFTSKMNFLSYWYLEILASSHEISRNSSLRSDHPKNYNNLIENSNQHYICFRLQNQTYTKWKMKSTYCARSLLNFSYQEIAK